MTTEKIPYWKSNRFLKAFVYKTGDDGCVVCPDERIRLSLDRKPPPLRHAPPPPRIEKQVEKREQVQEDPYVRMLVGLAHVVHAGIRFKKWLDTPPPPPAPKTLSSDDQENKNGAPPFDIQEIPNTMRKLGMKQGAKMLDRWFAGELNYSRTRLDLQKGINQNGQLYPASMVDSTSISFEWIMTFDRAQSARKTLAKDLIYNPYAIAELKKILKPHRSSGVLRAAYLCGDQPQELHERFQFQKISVGSGLSQRINQYLTQEIANRGIPDELTVALGSFSLYAAVSRANFEGLRGKIMCHVTHIYIYAKDSFDFADEEQGPSQYLGHWNKNGVAIVPTHQAMIEMGSSWIDHPVLQDASKANFDILYPVKNSDFRAWQLKHQRGGDFIIFTDREPIYLDTPITLELDDAS